MFKKLANNLFRQARIMAARAFGVKTKLIKRSLLKQILERQTLVSNYWFSDGEDEYRYTKLSTIKDILRYDLISEEPYLDKGRRDCDKFATAVYNRFRWVYGVNTMGLAKNTEVRSTDTGKLICKHRANVFLAEDDYGALGVYYLEPQTDEIIEMDCQNDIIKGSKKYVLKYLEF